MHKCVRVFFSLFFFALLPTIACAATAADDSATPFFDVVSANHKFDEISLELAGENVPTQTFSQAIDMLTELAKDAGDCVQQTEEKIKDLDIQITNITGAGKKSVISVDTKYLENQRSELKQKQANCRLFFIRSGDAIKAYRNTLLSTQKKMTFTKGEYISTRLRNIANEPQKITLPTLNKEPFKDIVNYSIYSASLFVLALFFSWQLKPFMHRKSRKSIIHFLFNGVLIFCILFFSVSWMLIEEPFTNFEKNTNFQHIMMTTVIYLIFLFAYLFTLNLRWLPRAFNWKGFNLAILKKLGLVISTIYFFHLIGFELLALLSAPENLLQLFQDIILIISLITMTYFSLLLFHSNRKLLEKYFSKARLYKTLGVIWGCFLILDFCGYSILAVSASYILFSFLLTSTLGALLFLSIGRIYKKLNYDAYYQNHFKKIFGYSKNPPFIELILLKIIGQIITIVGMTFLFAYLIGETSYFLDKFLDKFNYGFKTGGMTIIPAQWFIGLFVFCLLSLFSRHIATKINRGQQFKDTEEKQVAFASIVMYIGFAIATVFGLLLAGFNFTSLAIIAGALSVGIGLGLQSIVNNFFSGLILLIEQPIKPGDRIKINDIEGFVKKVSLRSTQIITPSQEDIIIPNSDLITHQVVNYMFSNKYWRVNCPIGVAYGSDTDKVCKVLMDVALANPEVVKSSPNNPLVFFRSFGESALLFELWCLIKDVNKKYIVTSDLNLAIDEAFRKNDISIAFPQHDVHVKFDQTNLPWKKDK